ncbi:hypothetical protein NX059_007214 [Plenodomus lindquistii]|nr:hypothetical protein NX059_007214 [Plenodomus lindquistii]
MLIMGSEWHPHGQLSEPSRFSLQTLPSVRELIESTDSTFHHTTNSVLPASADRPVSRSTPPSAPIQPVAANAPAAPEHASWNPVNHASPHVSPTNTTTPTSASEHQGYHFPTYRTATTSYAPLLTSGAPAHAQPPISSARQDSIFARLETKKEPQPITTSPNLPFPSARRSPNQSKVQVSSRPNSSPTTTASPSSANQTNSHPQVSVSRRTNSRPHSSSIQSSIASVGAEHVVALAQTHSGPKNMHETVTVEPQGSTQTRQQRFNVRFASSNNFSPTTFATAPAPRPRPSPPVMPVSPASPVETVESPRSHPEQPITTTEEQSTITRNDIRNMTEPAQDHSRTDRRSPSVERCLGCKEPWKRPIFDFQKPTGTTKTQNGNDLATGNMAILEQLRAHGRAAEMEHDRWKEKHYHCVPRQNYEPPTKADQDDSRSTRSSGSNGTSRGPAQNGTTIKRTRDSTPDAEQPSKVRKVTFDNGKDA